MYALQIDGSSVDTVEGLADESGELNKLAESIQTQSRAAMRLLYEPAY